MASSMSTTAGTFFRGTDHGGGSNHDNDDEDWSEDGDVGDDSGSRKRRRTTESGARPMSVSCEVCKQRKVKCDRGQPRCGWCVRNGHACEYKERKKPGLRAGYGRELEARLDKLESALHSQQALLEQLASQVQHGQPTRTDSSFFVQTPHVYTAGAADEGAHRPQIVGVDNLSQQESRTRHASASSIPLARIVTPSGSYTSTHPPVESPSLNITSAAQAFMPSEDGATTSVSANDLDLPPYDLLYALTDLYFKHINTWCPILHRRTTLDALFGTASLEEADRILLHAIVATTLRFSIDRRLDERTRERYHSTSKQRVLLYGLENSSVKALQALVILALDIVGTSNGPPGWNLLALITRSVVQLGLAVETTSPLVAPLYPSISTLRAMVLPEPKTFIEDESRRRLFWMVYLLDRYAMVATAFGFSLDEKEIDRRLPCRDELFSRNQPVETRWFQGGDGTDYSVDNPANLGSFSYYIEILGILSQIHRFLKTPVDIGNLSDVEMWQQKYRQLDTRLTSWNSGLPNEYGIASRFDLNGGNKTVKCVWIMLHATYHTTVIRLHSSAAYPTWRSPIFAPSFAASQRCLTAVDSILELCAYVCNKSMLNKLGPPFAFSLWVAARVLLVHGSTVGHDVNPAIGAFVDTLREMGVYWRVAERYATVLQRVLDEYHESVRAPDGRRETPSTVRILADMRRCAYDLDFLISRQPSRVPGSSGGGGSVGVGGGGGGGSVPRATSAFTPTRTPAPNELEYLDVFDFFNMPRLPLPSGGGGDAAVMAPGNPNGDVTSFAQTLEGSANNEFNITNFMFDTEADWFGNGTT